MTEEAVAIRLLFTAKPPVQSAEVQLDPAFAPASILVFANDAPRFTPSIPRSSLLLIGVLLVWIRIGEDKANKRPFGDLSVATKGFPNAPREAHDSDAHGE